MTLASPGSARRTPGSRGTASGGIAFWAGGSGWAAGALNNRHRHSRRVALLKRALPATGLALLLLIALWPRLAPLWDRIRLAFPPIDLRYAGELQMVNPRYAGIDRAGRPFVVTAVSGRQAPDRQDLMSLQAPRADVKTTGGADIAVAAISGIYQSQVQLLDLFGDVTLMHQNGTRFVTQSARVDAANNTAEGRDPIEGRGPSGAIKAQGFRILDKGDTIVFTGKTDMVLKGATPGTPKSAPAALPAAVAALATQVETEAKPALAAASRPPAERRNTTARSGSGQITPRPAKIAPAPRKAP
jgi:lipopolysaccharide export system protein LptC